MKCCKCLKLINEGFFCSNSGRVWCLGCHEDLNIEKLCFHFHKETEDMKEHEHIRWINNLNERPSYLGINEKFEDKRENTLFELFEQ